MKFGSVPLAEAEGAVLAHSVHGPAGRMAKGRYLLAEDLETLRSWGLTEVVVAQLEPGDVDEDSAAFEVACALGGNSRIEAPDTGRCNLFATEDGVLDVDRKAIDGLNAVASAITVATLDRDSVVEAGRMIATVKVIPYGVARDVLADSLNRTGDGPVLTVGSWRRTSTELVQTNSGHAKPSVLKKTRDSLDARLAVSGNGLAGSRTVGHDARALAETLHAATADLVVVFGVSAMADAADVVPEAIRLAGGTVSIVGMPVDPGNLLCLGRIGSRTVIGAPGCARTNAFNGFDLVLNRVLSDLPVTPDWIGSLGVGGLLMETTRPQPRQTVSTRFTIAVLAAGRSTRMGERNKLLEPVEGRPMVRHVCDAALKSGLGTVLAVLGHEANAVGSALPDGVKPLENTEFASGLASSVRVAARRAIADRSDALIVMLADMPHVTASDLQRIAKRFRDTGGDRIVVPLVRGAQRGNPVVFPSSRFAHLLELEGDKGARDLLTGPDIVTVAIGAQAGRDYDTPEDFSGR